MPEPFSNVGSETKMVVHIKAGFKAHTEHRYHSFNLYTTEGVCVHSARTARTARILQGEVGEFWGN